MNINEMKRMNIRLVNMKELMEEKVKEMDSSVKQVSVNLKQINGKMEILESN